jgi:GDPmannose 4,6-dehydratase
MKRALITGITGQDGAYLASLLLSLGYKVFGGVRRTSSPHDWRLRYLGIQDHPNLELLPFDLSDHVSCLGLVDAAQPNEVYNLAAQSFVGVSFSAPISTMSITGLGALHMLEATRKANTGARFYQASTSEMFSGGENARQNETTPFKPRSPYGAAKLAAHHLARIYREAHGMFVSCGILFNHESPLRGEEFVTRKITMGVARMARDPQAIPVYLGNLNARRDWGHAAEYVGGMHMMLQTKHPDDFVLATGAATRVGDFAIMAAQAAGFEAEWKLADYEEQTQIVDAGTGRILFMVSPTFYRPNEVHVLCGDASKARRELNWIPAIKVKALAAEMVAADMQRTHHEAAVRVVPASDKRFKIAAGA